MKKERFDGIESVNRNKSVEENLENFDLMLILTLFKKETFYIFHQCICQQLTLGTIDSKLLDELKKLLFFKTE